MSMGYGMQKVKRVVTIISASVLLLWLAGPAQAAVELSYFFGEWSEPSEAILYWGTESEAESAGFWVWRSETNLTITNGQINTAGAVRLNSTIISNPDSPPCDAFSWNDYEWVDTTVDTQKPRYYYYLESQNCGPGSVFYGDGGVEEGGGLPLDNPNASGGAPTSTPTRTRTATVPPATSVPSATPPPSATSGAANPSPTRAADTPVPVATSTNPAVNPTSTTAGAANCRRNCRRNQHPCRRGHCRRNQHACRRGHGCCNQHARGCSHRDPGRGAARRYPYAGAHPPDTHPQRGSAGAPRAANPCAPTDHATSGKWGASVLPLRSVGGHPAGRRGGREW